MLQKNPGGLHSICVFLKSTKKIFKSAIDVLLKMFSQKSIGKSGWTTYVVYVSFWSQPKKYSKVPSMSCWKCSHRNPLELKPKFDLLILNKSEISNQQKFFGQLKTKRVLKSAIYVYLQLLFQLIGKFTSKSGQGYVKLDLDHHEDFFVDICTILF